MGRGAGIIAGMRDWICAQYLHQLVGGEMSCVLVVPGAAWGHEERLRMLQLQLGNFPAFPVLHFQ